MIKKLLNKFDEIGYTSIFIIFVIIITIITGFAMVHADKVCKENNYEGLITYQFEYVPYCIDKHGDTIRYDLLKEKN